MLGDNPWYGLASHPVVGEGRRNTPTCRCFILLQKGTVIGPHAPHFSLQQPLSSVPKVATRNSTGEVWLLCLLKIVIFSQSFEMVQSILMHVLSVSPASGPRLLPIAKVLAESLLSNSNGQAAIDFLEKLSLTIAIKVPGAHGDLEALPWREFPLLPVNEEIQRDTSQSGNSRRKVAETSVVEFCYHASL